MDNRERLSFFRKKIVLPRMNQMAEWIMWLSYFCALIFMLTLVYRYGFNETAKLNTIVHTITNIVWVVFIINVITQYLFTFNDRSRKITFWTRVLDVCLFLTLIPVIFHKPEEDNIALWIWNFFHHPFYKGSVLLLISLTLLSGFLVHLLGKKTNPSLIFASSFLILILIGSGLLMLPKATYGGISWIDALFTSTSAVCVTGLVTLDVPSTFTMHGQIIIILLIQIGGLGVMTLTSFFAMFFMGNTSLYNQLVIGDMISSNSLNSLLSTLLYILGFTLVIEGIGMIMIWLDIHGTLGMPLDEELYFAAFHSISAFCNAGFSIMPGGMGNAAMMDNHPTIYITLSVLIILGGIGFPILVNIKDTLFYYLKFLRWKVSGKSHKFVKQVHLYNLNTKIVFSMTVFLVVLGTVLILLFEWNKSMSGMSVTDKIIHSFFNSVCPRTAGFSSVSLTAFSVQSILLLIILMIIGGGTQSTAGGVKINVFSVILINLWAVVCGAPKTTVFQRELSHDSVRRSNASLMLYVIIVFAGIFVLTITDPDASLTAITFECVSALSTVGSTLDFTPLLSDSGKLIIVLLMFVGRVGAFTLVSGLINQERKKNFKYPSDNIIIN